MMNISLIQKIGIRVVYSPVLDKKVFIQVLFPKSKKKRIRKKWSKNPKYKKWVIDINQKPELLHNKKEDVVYCNTAAYRLIKSIGE